MYPPPDTTLEDKTYVDPYLELVCCPPESWTNPLSVLDLVFGSPVTGPKKDRDLTGLRLIRTTKY